MRYEVVTKPIDNGWLTTFDIEGKPLVQKYWKTELQALVAAQAFFKEAIRLTIEETKKKV